MSTKLNRLSQEKSPYLLQHADNPVDWYPWGEKAFRKAREEDKPIFLSIGYSTCHWCHVMEHESFEDEEVAQLLNENIVCIKVDREERPDIDAIYMNVCQMITGSGGWPLTIIMTPDKKPFFAGTYIPKYGRFGRMGLMELIPKIKVLWENDRQKILQSAKEITKYLQQSEQMNISRAPDHSILEKAFEEFRSSFDEKYGGFGRAPKFPSPHNLLFLLRYWKSSQNPMALEMVEKTLLNMRLGGIFDQIAYGFHRYSTDERWLVPHFEKMIYDQAMLALAYGECYLASGNIIYKNTMEEILTYVLRDMTSPLGGFYSAEDADSEGEEGKFYVWTMDEIQSFLSPEDAQLAMTVFNMKAEGNYLEEATHRTTGNNILHLSASPSKLTAQLGLSEKEFTEKLESIRKKLFLEREKRVHPLKDDKILTDWNGLMIASLSRAAQITGQEKYQGAAQKAIHFILENLCQKNQLYHRYREGEMGIPAFLDDYAFLIWGLIEFYETSFEPRYLRLSIELMEDALHKFWDENQGGFYFTAAGDNSLLVRKKEFYDGAIPSGNSVMMFNLLRLGRITGKVEWENRAAQISAFYGALVEKYPAGYSMYLCALQFAIGPTFEVVIVGDPQRTDTREILDRLWSVYVPNKVVLSKGLQNSEQIDQLAPFLGNFRSVNNRATSYVCVNYQCNLPTTSAEEMLKQLTSK